MANPAQPTPYKGSGKLRPEELIYQEMLGAILDRRLEPGMKLIEEDLAKTFSVSRARFRATFLQLAHDKLINLVPNRGAFISAPTIDEAIEVLSARRMTEDGVVRKIAAKMTPDRANQIREHLERLILRSSLIIAMYESPQPVDCSHSEHETLLNALLGGDPDAAAAEMAKHLDAIRDRLQIQRPKPAKTDFASIFGRNPKSVAS